MFTLLIYDHYLPCGFRTLTATEAFSMKGVPLHLKGSFAVAMPLIPSL